MENMRMIQEKRKKMRSQLEEAYRQQDEERGCGCGKGLKRTGRRNLKRSCRLRQIEHESLCFDWRIACFLMFCVALS